MPKLGTRIKPFEKIIERAAFDWSIEWWCWRQRAVHFAWYIMLAITSIVSVIKLYPEDRGWKYLVLPIMCVWTMFTVWLKDWCRHLHGNGASFVIPHP